MEMRLVNAVNHHEGSVDQKATFCLNASNREGLRRVARTNTFVIRKTYLATGTVGKSVQSCKD